MLAAGDHSIPVEHAHYIRSPIEREQLQRLARDLMAGGGHTLALRGAMLHADAMMLGQAPEVRRLTHEQARREQAAGRQVLVIGLDGHHDGFGIVPRHWPLARRLLLDLGCVYEVRAAG